MKPAKGAASAAPKPAIVVQRISCQEIAPAEIRPFDLSQRALSKTKARRAGRFG